MSFVVTGMGAISRFGLSAAGAIAALSRPQDDRPEGGETPGVTVAGLLGPKGTQFMDRATALAIFAARSALADAALPPAEATDGDVGLVLGSSNGSLASIATMTRDTYERSPPYHVSAMEFPNTVMNAPAGQCAISHALRGLNTTVSGGRLSGLVALRYAMEKITLGYAESLLVGAVEEWGKDACGWQEHARALCGSRPMPVGEGVVFLHVETAEAARAAGRRAQAEILACRTGFDPDLERGASARPLEAAARACLDQAGIAPEGVCAVVVSEIGYADVDACERAAVDALFGNRLPRIVSPTGALGDTMSALNLFQILAGLAAVADVPGEARVLVLCAEPGGRVGALLFARAAPDAPIETEILQ